MAQVTGLAAGEYPAADRRDQRHPDQDDEQVGDRDRGEDGAQATAERVGTEPARGADVATDDAEQRAGEAERAGGGGGEVAAGSPAGPGGGQGAQVAGGFAADQADAHGQ